MVYTKETSDRTFMCQARLVDRIWQTSEVEGAEDLWLYQTSKDPGDSRARVIYRQAQRPTRYGWRELDDPAAQQWIPRIHQVVFWIEGARAVAGITEDYQLFLYELDTGTFTTPHTPEVTRHFTPTGYRDASGTTTLIAILDDTRIGIYKGRGDTWSLVNTIRPESRYPYVFHPKLWFHNGKP